MDKVLGVLAARMFSIPQSTVFHQLNTILFIRPGGIGDAVLLIPVIQALKRLRPHTIIDILAEKRNAAVFLLCPDVNAIFHYDEPRELCSVIRTTYDVVVDSEQWHRLSAVVARTTKAPMTIGFATNERKRLFTNPVPYSQDDFELISFQNLLTPLIVTSASHSGEPFFTIPQVVAEKAREVLSPIYSRKIVALFPGGSIAQRRWGANHFRQVAEKLSEQGYRIIAVGGSDDVRYGEQIVSGLLGALNLCGKLSLPETAAVLKESSLLITGDSGIMHIGYGLGIKIVALFGPGRERKWAPRGANCIVINKKLACSPCTTFGYTPKCKKKAECMQQISVEEVTKAALELLNR